MARFEGQKSNRAPILIGALVVSLVAAGLYLAFRPAPTPSSTSEVGATTGVGVETTPAPQGGGALPDATAQANVALTPLPTATPQATTESTPATLPTATPQIAGAAPATTGTTIPTANAGVITNATPAPRAATVPTPSANPVAGSPVVSSTNGANASVAVAGATSVPVPGGTANGSSAQ